MEFFWKLIAWLTLSTSLLTGIRPTQPDPTPRVVTGIRVDRDGTLLATYTQPQKVETVL